MTTESLLVEWANDYLTYARARFTAKTYNEKRFIFKRFFKIINPKLLVSELTVRQALAFLQKQAEDRSGYAANKERKNLLAAWSWGIKYMALPSPNPFLVDKFPEKRQPRYIPPERDFWKVYDAAESQDKIMLLAYLQLAARRSEIFRLQWEDVDFGESQVRITTRKRQGGHMEEDWLPMLDELYAALLQTPANGQKRVGICRHPRQAALTGAASTGWGGCAAGPGCGPSGSMPSGT